MLTGAARDLGSDCLTRVLGGGKGRVKVPGLVTSAAASNLNSHLIFRRQDSFLKLGGGTGGGGSQEHAGLLAVAGRLAVSFVPKGRESLALAELL